MTQQKSDRNGQSGELAARGRKEPRKQKSASVASAHASGATPASGERPPCRPWRIKCTYGFASAWVFVWIACAIWMAVGTLVARQSHDQLSEVRQALTETVAGAEQPNSNLLLSIDEVVALLHGREQLVAELRAHQVERLELVEEISRLETLVKDAEENRDRLLRQEEEAANSKVGPAAFRATSFQSVVALMPPAAEGAEEYAEARTELQSAKARQASLTARMEHVQARLDELTLDPKLELLAKDVRCVASVLGLFFYLPDYLVTLTLTLAMGALGSVIFITHKLFKGELHHRLSWYVMRPFLGMTLALAMYILARAGQFAMTDPSSGVADLNPFTIAFLGIISGLLSDQVYERITLAGERLVSGGSAPQNENPKAA